MKTLPKLKLYVRPIVTLSPIKPIFPEGQTTTAKERKILANRKPNSKTSERVESEGEINRAKRLKTSEPDSNVLPSEEVDEDLPLIFSKDAGWEDLDIGDEDDPLMVSEYVNEVYDYLRVIEVRFYLATCII